MPTAPIPLTIAPPPPAPPATLARFACATRRALLGMAAAAGGVAAAPEPANLHCGLQLPARAAVGEPLRLRWTLANGSRQPMRVLAWGTPVEGWYGPFVSLRRDDKLLPYRGATAKRGDPDSTDYLALPAGQSVKGIIDLRQAFELTQPGRYRVEPRLLLHDVMVGNARRNARPRTEHRPLLLDCPSLEFELRAAPR